MERAEGGSVSLPSGNDGLAQTSWDFSLTPQELSRCCWHHAGQVCLHLSACARQQMVSESANCPGTSSSCNCICWLILRIFWETPRAWCKDSCAETNPTAGVGSPWTAGMQSQGCANRVHGVSAVSTRGCLFLK